MNPLLVIVICTVVIPLAIIGLILTCPFGYEDKFGFHLGEEGEDEDKKL